MAVALVECNVPDFRHRPSKALDQAWARAPQAGAFAAREVEAQAGAAIASGPLAAPVEDAINKFDLDGRWGWLRKSAKWLGVAAAVGCVVATAGVCGGLAFAAVAASAAWNARQAYAGRQSWKRAAINTGFDAASLAFRPLRAWNTRRAGSVARYAKSFHIGRHRVSSIGHQGRTRISHRARWHFAHTAKTWRTRPWRSAGVAAVNAGYGARSYREHSW